jgi:anti-sigma B factor antagonist
MRSDQILEVAVENLEDRRVIRVRGEVDLSSVDALRGAIAAARREGVATLVDLSEVGFMDSTGLHLLLDTALGAKEDGWSVSFRPSRQVMRLLEVTGTVDVLGLVPADSSTDADPG